MDDLLEGEALRLHLAHCDGCPECSHSAPDGTPYSRAEARRPERCPHLANNRDDCWECFAEGHPAIQEQDLKALLFGAEAFGPGEDYEGREPAPKPEGWEPC